MYLIFCSKYINLSIFVLIRSKYMTNIQPEKVPLHDDEFDIEILAQKLYRIVYKLVYKLAYPLRVAFQKPKRILFFVSFGIILALILRFTLAPVYQSDFVMKPKAKYDLFFVDIFNDLETLIENKDFNELSNQLKLDVNTCKKIADLDMEITTSRYSQDTVKSFMITIYTEDYKLFDSIQNGVIRYLENNDHYSKVLKIRTSNLLAIRNKVIGEIAGLDSLKKAITNNLQPKVLAGGIVYSEPLNPVPVFEKGIQLYKEQAFYNEELQYLINFELIKTCVPSTKRYSPRLIFLLPLGILFGIFLSFVFTISETYWKKHNHS